MTVALVSSKPSGQEAAHSCPPKAPTPGFWNTRRVITAIATVAAIAMIIGVVAAVLFTQPIFAVAAGFVLGNLVFMIAGGLTTIPPMLASLVRKTIELSEKFFPPHKQELPLKEPPSLPPAA